jgi:hypothetical protein
MVHAYLASTIKICGIKENKMANLKDLVKAALEKKQAEQAQVKSDSKTDTAKSPGVQSQVNTNKPAKKSAGRGR